MYFFKFQVLSDDLIQEISSIEKTDFIDTVSIKKKPVHLTKIKQEIAQGNFVAWVSDCGFY